MNIDLIENCNIILPIQKDKSLKEHASIILRGKMQTISSDLVSARIFCQTIKSIL